MGKCSMMKTLHSIRQLQQKNKKVSWEILLGSQSENAPFFICHYSKGECFFSPWDLLLQEIWFNDVSGLFRDISSLVGMLDGRLTCQRKGTTIIVYVRFWPLICYLSTRFSFFLVHSNFVCMYSEHLKKNNIISKNPRAPGFQSTHNGRSKQLTLWL